MITLDRVSHDFQNRNVISNVSLSIEKNGLCCIGANGTGKTTLLKIISGKLKPMKGTVHYQDPGYDARNEKGKRGIGVCFNDIGLFPLLSPRENLRLFAKLGKLSDIPDHSLKDIQDFRIETILDQKTHLLSSGELQKLALIRSWILQPKVLILDEPSNFLDQESKSILLHRLEAEKTRKTLMILASHDSDFISQIDLPILSTDKLHQGLSS
ncbi:MAG: ABC transporter ATP-binding protein [Bdellovibrionales bacterium]|nr:ABC transporter ATP-binding protein [Bdellovibrionales bacterium]